MKIIVPILIICLIQDSSNEDVKCPPLPRECKCSIKKSKSGVRITCNGLQRISFNDFPSNLTADIDISGSNLKDIKMNSFPHPNKIRKLVLKNNTIKRIEAGSFKGFTSLKKLDLSWNHLLQIKDSTFDGLKETLLSYLDLRRNKIISISNRAFRGMNIDKLLLSEQLNIHHQRISILLFADFLTLSLIKMVDLDGINLLCDCNLQWLTNWMHNSDLHTVSKNSKCFYPVQYRGKMIQDLAKDWKCDEYDLMLPQFNVQPSHNQFLFGNDSFVASCQSPWLPKADIEWFSDGRKLDVMDENVKIDHDKDIESGSYTSTLLLKRMSLYYFGNLICRLIVRGSGHIETSVKLFVSGSTQVPKCLPNVSKTLRGTMAWPTALSGARLQASCPYGGSRLALAYRTCNNGAWSSVVVDDCFMARNITAELQRFYALVQKRDVKKIKFIGNQFSYFFTQNFESITTTYDLYFAYKTLYEIMKTYENVNGTYSLFFWSSVGLLAENHIQLTSMGEMINGKTGGWRFRNLLQSFVKQESEKLRRKYSIGNHELMAAVSYKERPRDPLECSIHSAPKTLHLQVICGNKTVKSMSTVSFQIGVGSRSEEIRITSVVFNITTFFQPTTQNYSFISSPVTGLELVDPYSKTNPKNTSKHALISYRTESLKHHSNPKLVFWKVGSGWTESKNCTAVTKMKNLTQFECILHPNFFDDMVYFGLAMSKFAPAQLTAKYMEAILYVGAVFSCLFLCATLLVYVFFRQLRYNRSDAATLMNLCLALMFTEIIFAVGMHRTDHKLLCQGVAVSLHYFMLCSLIWLGCGAMVLIRLLKNYTRSVTPEYDPVLKYYLVAWGIPLIICSITVATLKENSADPDYCWLPSRTSLGAFVIPGSLIFLTDFVLSCYLHALINRVFPEPLEPVVKEKEPIDRDKCNPNSCKYKLKAAEKMEKQSLRREELLYYLHGSLLVLLFFILTFSCTLMMYAYKSSASRYLYYFFSYAAAACNVCIGGVIFLYHFFKRKDAVKHVVEFITHIRHRKHMVDTEAEELIDLAGRQSPTMEGGNAKLDNMYEPSDIVSEHNSNYLDMTHGVYGLSDQVQSEGSHVITTLRAETCPAFDSVAESLDELDNGKIRASNILSVPTNESECDIGEGNMNEPLSTSHNKSQQSQSEMSDLEKRSVGKQNSIGECSLASSRTKRVRPKNPDIPENLKSFVPENWRPARRKKGGSYYPYFISENAPITASLAYSSKSSSIASTTISGVPLYINKKRAANNLAMYNDLFSKIRSPANPMGPIRQPNQSGVSTNLPMHIGQGTNFPMHIPPNSGHAHVVVHPNHVGLTMLNPVQEGNIPPSSVGSNSTSTGVLMNNNKPNQEPSGGILDENEKVYGEEEEEEEDEIPIVIAPIIYVPMPHVTKKQFEWRSETPV